MDFDFRLRDGLDAQENVARQRVPDRRPDNNSPAQTTDEDPEPDSAGGEPNSLAVELVVGRTTDLVADRQEKRCNLLSVA